MMLAKAPTDWNDLHCIAGLAEVRKQILAKLEPALEAHLRFPHTPLGGGVPAEKSPPPAQGSGEKPEAKEEITLQTVKRRYALVEGDTKVFDTYTKTIIKKNAFELLVTRELARE